MRACCGAEASQPEDWDEEEDGEWEPPKVANPKCKEAPGCGEWKRPTKPNPDYKGKWSAPLIDNPDYKVCENATSSAQIGHHAVESTMSVVLAVRIVTPKQV
jgi:hypothetical protein